MFRSRVRFALPNWPDSAIEVAKLIVDALPAGKHSATTTPTGDHHSAELTYTWAVGYVAAHHYTIDRIGETESGVRLIYRDGVTGPSWLLSAVENQQRPCSFTSS